MFGPRSSLLVCKWHLGACAWVGRGCTSLASSWWQLDWVSGLSPSPRESSALWFGMGFSG